MISVCFELTLNFWEIYILLMHAFILWLIIKLLYLTIYNLHVLTAMYQSSQITLKRGFVYDN